jgi:hypothetical protein
MMDIELISLEEAEKAGGREELVLLEQTPRFYPEFEVFLRKEMNGRSGRLSFRGASGMAYVVAPLKDSDQGLQGIGISVRKSSDSPADPAKVDLDLWSFLEWLVDQVDGEWNKEALRKTGAIYRVPGALDRG